MNELWSDDFEVLHWFVERFERTGNSIEVGEALRVFPEEQYDSVRESLRRLSSHTYVVSISNSSGGPRRGAWTAPSEATEHALRLSGAFPDNAELLADRMLAVLAEGAVNEPDPEKRFKFEAGLKGVGGMTRDVLVDVLAAAIARSTAPAGAASAGATATRSWPRPYEAITQDHP
ncbi:MAG: hypothetical protein ACRDRX_15145 [Pseudonocardiaceae bacterium]